MSSVREEAVLAHANEAAMELLHQMGGMIETRRDPLFEPRDWEAENYLDVWVGQYFRNVAESYHEILRERHIGPMRDVLHGQPVAVVGAGPSLDCNAEGLRRFPGLIIACDRAAKALTARGIKPDLVVCVDPRPAVMAEMLNYPENRQQRLVLSVLADPEVARIWRGPKFYMSTVHPGTQFFDRCLPELFPGMPGTLATGNVGNTAVQLGHLLGADKLVLVGHDYAYTGGKMHCDDWVRYPSGQWIRIDDPDEHARRLAQRSGKIVEQGIETYGPFLSYRDTLLQMVQELNFDVVNATEGGILTTLPCAKLEDVVEQLSLTHNAREARALLAEAIGGAL